MRSRYIILICLAWISLQVHAEYSIVHFERAYELIYRRLYHQQEVPFRDIVFAIENAYLGDSLNYKEYIDEIERMTSALHQQAEAYAPSMPSWNSVLIFGVQACCMNSTTAIEWDNEYKKYDLPYNGIVYVGN